LVNALCCAIVCRSCRDRHFFSPKETKAIKVKTSGGPWHLRLVQTYLDNVVRHYRFIYYVNLYIAPGATAQTPRTPCGCSVFRYWYRLPVTQTECSREQYCAPAFGCPYLSNPRGKLRSLRLVFLKLTLMGQGCECKDKTKDKKRKATSVHSLWNVHSKNYEIPVRGFGAYAYS